MSEANGEPAEPTVVVGYPEAAARPDPTAAGLDRLTAQTRAVRRILIGCVALLALLALVVAAALTETNAQLEALTKDVAALSAQSPPVPAPVAAAPSPASTAAAAAAPQQLGTAPPIDPSISLPRGADQTGAILIGDPKASNVVEVYVDYQCPFCQRWEAQVGSALIDAAVEPGSGLLVKQYTMAFLGESNQTLNPPGASARAANAALCVRDVDGEGVFVQFSRSLFATADPTEPKGQFPVAQLASLAKGAGASPKAVSCIKAGTHVPFVAATTRAAFLRGVTGTPTAVVNGRTLGNAFSDQSLTTLAAAG